MTTVLLLIIGILLIVVNVKAVKSEKNSFKDVFDNASTNVKNYDLEIEKLRKEFAESLFELQEEIEELKDKLKKSNNINSKNIDNVHIKNTSYENIEENILNKYKFNSIEIYSDENTVEEIKNTNRHEEINEINNSKIDNIEKLMQEGLSVDDISQKMGIGKGEILLIQKLYIK